MRRMPCFLSVKRGNPIQKLVDLVRQSKVRRFLLEH